ncbi:3-oxo-tetronate kinase [Microlunatus sp. GCM10028923]|uniref:3-oxo-tetronate kinase n=1 Tax=Microlunatus sp. GCM10028923 TaxID=3273400 RepID=UPI003621076C
MIGIIADDATGASDVAAALTRRGVRTALAFDADVDPSEVSGAGAVVVGLKTRTAERQHAVALSLRALKSLQECGATRFYVKYCSTFDSTADGNIGPITDAVADALGAAVVVTTPSAPRHRRSVYQGHLFVGDSLINETHMAQHPLTPMTDSSVPRLLQAQTPHRVALLGHRIISQGEPAIRAAIADAQRDGVRHLVADAIHDDDLSILAAAVGDAPLTAGSAGLVEHLLQSAPGTPTRSPSIGTRTVIIAGSCSRRTCEQIDHYVAAGGAHYRVAAMVDSDEDQLVADGLGWFDAHPAGPVLFYSSQAATERVKADSGLSDRYERIAGRLAGGVRERGVRRIIVAGGETSGAVINALGVRVTLVESEAAPGVPWLYDGRSGTRLLLKSGNFGPPDLFTREGGLA